MDLQISEKGDRTIVLKKADFDKGVESARIACAKSETTPICTRISQIKRKSFEKNGTLRSRAVRVVRVEKTDFGKQLCYSHNPPVWLSQNRILRNANAANLRMGRIISPIKSLEKTRLCGAAAARGLTSHPPCSRPGTERIGRTRERMPPQRLHPCRGFSPPATSPG